jgi:hypothetical protein
LKKVIVQTKRLFEAEIFILKMYSVNIFEKDILITYPLLKIFLTRNVFDVYTAILHNVIS